MSRIFAAAVAACLLVTAAALALFQPKFLFNLHMHVDPLALTWSRIAFAATVAFLVGAFAFRRMLIIPWVVCTIVGDIAWPLGWQTYVRAQGGPGLHRGRFGADAIHFVRRDPQARRVPRLHGHMALALLALTVAPLMSACTTTSGTSGSDTIAKAQAYARAACQFLPTAETVADIIKAGDARLSTAKAIGDAICAALNPATPGNASALFTHVAPAVDGVAIKGTYVGK